MTHALQSPSAPPSTSVLHAFLHRELVLPRHPRREPGQGLVEYGLLLVLISLVTIGSVAMIGAQAGDSFHEFNCTLSGVHHAGNSNC